MVIWIDGTFGVGKSTVTANLLKFFTKEKAQALYSDEYWFQHRFLGGGCYPQNNSAFLSQFKEHILNCINQGNEIVIVDMALTDIKCRDELLGKLQSEGIDILHFILDADNEVIKERILFDKIRDEKDSQIKKIAQNKKFFLDNYKNAIWINAGYPSPADDIFQICVQHQKGIGVNDD